MTKRIDIGINKQWYQGSDKNFRIPVVDESDQPVNMTGWKLRWTLHAYQGEPELLNKRSEDSEILIEDYDGGTKNSALIQTVDTDTIGQAPATPVLAPGTYWHELWRVDEGFEYPLCVGIAVLQASGRRQETA